MRWLVFIDADVFVEPSCLGRLLAPLRDGRAQATVGNYSRDVAGMSFAARYKQLYIACVNNRRRGYLNTFWTAIGAVDARCFADVGGFDTAFKGANGEDAELGARLARRGYRVLPVADALGQHRHALTLRQLLTNDWRKGMGAMRHYFRNKGALSDNCHATHRDKLAVVAATLMAPLAVALLLPGQVQGALFVLLAASTAYLGLRADILRSFASQGVPFTAAALPVMFLLDLLRGACVATGLLRRGAMTAMPRAASDLQARAMRGQGTVF